MALKSLGAAGEASGPIFREADPIVRKTRDLAKTGVSPTTELARLFVSLKQTKGWDALVKLIYNTTASLNGFDKYGHFGRTLVSLTNCLEYELEARRAVPDVTRTSTAKTPAISADYRPCRRCSSS